jgi:hypothetical protein
MIDAISHVEASVNWIGILYFDATIDCLPIGYHT